MDPGLRERSRSPFGLGPFAGGSGGVLAGEDNAGGSRKRGLFLDTSQALEAKAGRMNNAEFRTAFQAFDSDRSGFIDVVELRNALQAVKWAVEAGSPRAALQPRPFQATTCCWLCARFGDGSRLSELQFVECMGYLSNLRAIFEQVDADGSGSVSCSELHRAFQLTGVALDFDIVAQVGRSYDADQSGTLEFDEFVQMRLEWDYYVSAWDQCTAGSAVIAPQQLLNVLEEIKRSLEPVGSALTSQVGVQMLPFQGLVYTSMFKRSRPFQPQTCEALIIRFGNGKLFLSFSQFCAMLVFLKEMKSAFCKVDTDCSGSLNVTELSNAFAMAGMRLQPDLVIQIGRAFDRDSSGEIEFDEFLQMAAEWNDLWQGQAHFGATAAGRISAATLQELFGSVRVLYRVVNGAVQTLRPFSLNTCRWLVAKFGTPKPGEVFAQGVEWNEFLNLIQYIKDSYVKFVQCDVSHTGTIGAQELGVALDAQGLHLSPAAVDNIRRCYDVDLSGSFEFDEFLQLLVECQLYNRCFDARLAEPAILTPLNPLNPLLGTPITTCSAPGLVTLDKSAFFSMVFAVPRNLSQ